MRPTVSVIIPTHDRPDLLGEALHSIALQDCDLAAVEVIIVNNGRMDVAPQARRASEHFTVRVHTLPGPVGPAVARNVGMEDSRGDHIAFLDDDDVYLPGHLRVALGALEAGDIQAAYTNCLVTSTRVDPTRPVTGALRSLDHPYSREFLAVCPHIAVHCAVYRSFRDTGARFDAAFGGVDDWEVQLRLAYEHGYRLRYVDEPTVVYHRFAPEASLTGQIARDAATQARWVRLIWRVWKRWPARDGRTTRYRRHLMEGVLLALKREGGRPQSLSYYDRCVRQLAAAWHGLEPEEGLVERLAGAATGVTDAAPLL